MGLELAGMRERGRYANNMPQRGQALVQEWVRMQPCSAIEGQSLSDFAQTFPFLATSADGSGHGPGQVYAAVKAALEALGWKVQKTGRTDKRVVSWPSNKPFPVEDRDVLKKQAEDLK